MPSAEIVEIRGAHIVLKFVRMAHDPERPLGIGDRAFQNDPVDKTRFHERNQHASVKLCSGHVSRDEDANRDILAQHLARKQMATGAEVCRMGSRENTIHPSRHTYSRAAMPGNHSLSVEILYMRHIYPRVYCPKLLKRQCLWQKWVQFNLACHPDLLPPHPDSG